MTVSTLTLTPDTCSPVSGAGAYAEPALTAAAHAVLAPVLPDLARVADFHALERVAASTVHGSAVRRGAKGDYWRWLAHIQAAAACSHPVRLHGQLHTVDTTTGEMFPRAHTNDMPDAVIYKACGNRRSAVCPACAEVYRADTYQLILAGLHGGKGTPETVQTIRARSPPSPRRASGWCTRPGRRTADPGCADHAGPRNSARTASTSRATGSTATANAPSAHHCAPTATTTPPRSCGTASPVNSGAAPWKPPSTS